mmetsp:Transcript_62773/g.123579  ORF Transcript_62773/g.123579 Transcript_62773/m.123579 type:complete len:234 (-) Transcript_62773:92-793(-)
MGSFTSRQLASKTSGTGVGASGVVSGAGPVAFCSGVRSLTLPSLGNCGASGDSSMTMATVPDVHDTCECSAGLRSGDLSAAASDAVMPRPEVVLGRFGACASNNNFNISSAFFELSSVEQRSKVLPAWSFQSGHRGPGVASAAACSASTDSSRLRRASAASRLTRRKACSLFFARRLAASLAARSSWDSDLNCSKMASAFWISSLSTSVRRASARARANMSSSPDVSALCKAS